MAAIDWKLVLEFLKVLVPPTATVLGAVWVAKQGLRAFRRQKAVERRVDWYERMCRQLGVVGGLFMRAKTLFDQNVPGAAEVHMVEAGKQVDVLLGICSEAVLYGSPESVSATAQLSSDMIGSIARATQSKEHAQHAATAVEICNRTSAAIAREFRVELGLEDLKGKIKVRNPQSPLPAGVRQA